MIAIGFFLAVMAVSVLQWLRGKPICGKYPPQRWLLRAWMFSAPLGFIAIDSGWIVRCVDNRGQSMDSFALRIQFHVPASNVLVSLISLRSSTPFCLLRPCIAVALFARKS